MSHLLVRPKDLRDPSLKSNINPTSIVPFLIGAAIPLIKKDACCFFKHLSIPHPQQTAGLFKAIHLQAAQIDRG